MRTKVILKCTVWLVVIAVANSLLAQRLGPADRIPVYSDGFICPSSESAEKSPPAIARLPPTRRVSLDLPGKRRIELTTSEVNVRFRIGSDRRSYTCEMAADLVSSDRPRTRIWNYSIRQEFSLHSFGFSEPHSFQLARRSDHVVAIAFVDDWGLDFAEIDPTFMFGIERPKPRPGKISYRADNFAGDSISLYELARNRLGPIDKPLISLDSFEWKDDAWQATLRINGKSLTLNRSSISEEWKLVE